MTGDLLQYLPLAVATAALVLVVVIFVRFQSPLRRRDRRGGDTTTQVDDGVAAVESFQPESTGQGLWRRALALKPYLIVFTASACGLIIEIVAGRILAPSIGVSLFTWTSIIGVVLAGISAGNYLGGRIADRFPHPTTLGFILLASGVLSLSVLPLVGPASAAYFPLPFILRIVLLTATLFFLPSLLLGMVTPVVIKLELRDLARAGSVVGKIYALSAAGSILGTFLTGFVLIQWIGTRPIIVVVSLVLVLLALAFGNLWRARTPGLALLAIFVGLASFSYIRGNLTSVCHRESNYFCIIVGDQEVEGRPVKTLILDKLIHSYVDLENPGLLVYGYLKVFDDVATLVGQQNPQMKVLFIGGGGYTMPRLLAVTYPNSKLEVIEIDPAVTEVAFQYLGLWPRSNIVTYNRDARMKVPELPEGAYDLVFGDAFADVSIPYHLTTLEFNEQVKALLNDRGMYVVNVVDKLHSGRFLKAIVYTLQRSFPHVYLLRDDTNWDEDRRYPYVVVGSRWPLTAEALEQATLQAGRGQPTTQFLAAEALADWLASKGAILLTDGYAPVDNLVAHLALELY